MGVSLPPPTRHAVIIEHLDPELEAWQALEYQCVKQECEASGTTFLLSGVASASKTRLQLRFSPESLTEQSVETLYTTPEQRSKVCLLDPKGEHDLSPEDGEAFDTFLFGGILGDEPPRDRTSELRKLGFVGRRLGKEQMTTDTAVRVTMLVVQKGKRLHEIPYVDRPDIEIPTSKENASNPSESVSMPFKYVRGEDGNPVMPEGMLELLASDADKDILDLL